ncbi:Hypothetical predicted protein, partial [Pelobates cultripes]
MPEPEHTRYNSHTSNISQHTPQRIRQPTKPTTAKPHNRNLQITQDTQKPECTKSDELTTRPR